MAAVILDPARPITGLADSKRLSPARRAALYRQIVERALAWQVVCISADDIDRLNILQATLEGMSQALERLLPAPTSALIDGNRLPHRLCCPAQAIVSGDASEPAISAASILAKVTRDRYMLALDQRYPGYDFGRHAGYPTAAHISALQRLGPCPEHRRSFAPVRAVLVTTPDR